MFWSRILGAARPLEISDAWRQWSDGVTPTDHSLQVHAFSNRPHFPPTDHISSNRPHFLQASSDSNRLRLQASKSSNRPKVPTDHIRCNRSSAPTDHICLQPTTFPPTVHISSNRPQAPTVWNLQPSHKLKWSQNGSNRPYAPTDLKGQNVTKWLQPTIRSNRPIISNGPKMAPTDLPLQLTHKLKWSENGSIFRKFQMVQKWFKF